VAPRRRQRRKAPQVGAERGGSEGRGDTGRAVLARDHARCLAEGGPVSVLQYLGSSLTIDEGRGHIVYEALGLEVERRRDAGGEGHLYLHLNIVREIVQASRERLICAVQREVDTNELGQVRPLVLVGDGVLGTRIEDPVSGHDEHELANRQPVPLRGCPVDCVDLPHYHHSPFLPGKELAGME